MAFDVDGRIVENHVGNQAAFCHHLRMRQDFFDKILSFICDDLEVDHHQPGCKQRWYNFASTCWHLQFFLLLDHWPTINDKKRVVSSHFSGYLVFDCQLNSGWDIANMSVWT
jgi:hypothetical protein